MASGSVWGIDIGKSSLKAVRMGRGKDILELQTLFYQEYQPAEDGTIPPSESSRALEALIAKHPSVKKEPVHVALAGHAAFSRFIKLPAFDEKKLAEMVRFEAAQQIPYPIADVNWDFSLIDREYEPDEDREVGLFAIKKEYVIAFLADLQLSGIEPRGITTGPLAIYNFVRWDMEVPEDQATVILDIGWDHTDLVIVDGPRYWVRNLALNGNELTKAISTKLKLPFTEAESEKRNAAQAKESARIYKATELVLKDFVAEIQRSIAFYKAQNKDRQIQIGQLLLLGNGSKLPNVRPYFQKELGIPVDTVKRLTNLAFDDQIDRDEMDLLKEHLPSFAVAFGLGIQGCGEGFNDVNLLPEEVQQRQALEKKKPIAAIAVAIIWLTAIGAYLGASKSLERLNDVIAEANKHLKGLKAAEAQMLAAREPIAKLEADVRTLAGHTAGRNVPLEILNKLAGVLPKENAAIEEPTPAERKDLAQGKNIAKVAGVERAVAGRQDRLNDKKTWIVEMAIKPASASTLKVTLLVARKYVIGPQGPDDSLTKNALETGILADIRQAFPKAGFEGSPRKIYNLDKDLQPGGPFGGAPQQAYFGLTIGFEVETGAAPPSKVEEKVAASGSGSEEPR